MVNAVNTEPEQPTRPTPECPSPFTTQSLGDLLEVFRSLERQDEKAVGAHGPKTALDPTTSGGRA